jgi:hypothetical protein
MRSTKIALHLAALTLSTAILSAGAYAQGYNNRGFNGADEYAPGAQGQPAQSAYPVGRAANDGGMVSAKTENQPGGEGRALYNSAPSLAPQGQADEYKYPVGRSANDGGMLTTPQAEKGAERTGSSSNKEAFRSGNETYNFAGQGQPPKKAPGRSHSND